MIVENRRTRAHIDWPLIAMAFGLSLFGILVVTVATYSPTSTADSLLGHIAESSSAIRQCVFIPLAILVVSVVMNVIPYDFLRRRARLIYVMATVLVLLVWVFNRATGVKQWLDIIWGFTIQPTEFAKLAMILMLAKTLSSTERPMSNLPDFIRTFVILGIPCVIILLSGEMGSLLVILFLFLVMIYFANVPLKVFFGIIGAGILAVLALYGFMLATNSDSYRLARILAFINPDMYSASDAYQMLKSQTAIGSGGLTGIGAFVPGSMSQLNYVPADWTDFIFATIGEAFGFIGCTLILLVYLMIILRMLYLARYTRDRFGMLVIIGVMGMMLFHVFENIGMTIGVMPITGIPLPFLSYGGSNMVTNMGGIALVLNVTKNRSLSVVQTPQVNASRYVFSRSAVTHRR